MKIFLDFFSEITVSEENFHLTIVATIFGVKQ